MYKAQTSSIRGKSSALVRRIGQPAFWLLFAFEGLLLAGALLLVLQVLLPARAPLAQSDDYATVRAAIQSRLGGAVADTSIEVAPGTSAPRSSVSGFTLNGYTYYYYREGRAGFDPLSRGVFTSDQVEFVSRDRLGSDIVVIYRVPSKDRATN